LGGDVAVADPPPHKAGWSVAIERLEVPGAPDLGPLVLRRAAVSTAGDAEQWMTAGGVRYSHILDPRSGQPMTGRSSTTVVAPSGLVADGLDTALAVLGPREGMTILESTRRDRAGWNAAAAWVREAPDGRVQVVRSETWPAQAETAATHGQ
jgi:FAD:protein FMN transferase